MHDDEFRDTESDEEDQDYNPDEDTLDDDFDDSDDTEDPLSMGFHEEDEPETDF